MTSATKAAGAPPRVRRSWSTVAAFLFGMPAGVAILTAIYLGPHDTEIFRYVSHPVECVGVMLFCCALAALLAKAASQRRERAACRLDVVPAWDGKAVPVSETGALRAGLWNLGRRLQETVLVRRAEAILDFGFSRG